MKRIEWTEVRQGEVFFVIADETAVGWEFWERSSWEIQWYRMQGSPELMAKAEQMATGAHEYDPGRRSLAA